MTVAEILAIIRYLVALGQKIHIENREATLEEIEAAGISRKKALDELEQAIADAEGLGD